MKKYSAFEVKTQIINLLKSLIFVFAFLAVLLTILITLQMKFQPFSDFELHWNAAKNLNEYIKSGSLVLIYKFFWYLNFEPYYTALVTQILIFILLLYFLNKLVQFKNKNNILLILILLVYLSILMTSISLFGFLEVVPFASILILIGTVGIYNSKENKFINFLCLVIGLSMRAQVIIIYLIGLLCLILFSKKLNLKKQFYVLLFLALIVSSIVESVLIINSNQKDLIYREKRAPLYTGLIHPVKIGAYCGSWNSPAYDLALNEINQPFFNIINNYLEKESLNNFLDLGFCKLKRIFTDTGIGSNWIKQVYTEYPENKKLTMQINLISKLEQIGLFFGRIFIIITLITSIFYFKSKKENNFFAGLLLVLPGYFFVFFIFEVNSRYLPGLFILMLLPWCLFLEDKKKLE